MPSRLYLPEEANISSHVPTHTGGPMAAQNDGAQVCFLDHLHRITWELVRNANPHTHTRPPPPALLNQKLSGWATCVFISPPGYPDVHSSLETIGPKDKIQVLDKILMLGWVP